MRVWGGLAGRGHCKGACVDPLTLTPLRQPWGLVVCPGNPFTPLGLCGLLRIKVLPPRTTQGHTNTVTTVAFSLEDGGV